MVERIGDDGILLVVGAPLANGNVILLAGWAAADGYVHYGLHTTTIDNEKKVKDILTGAYPDHEYAVVCEYSSDNVDEFNNTNGSSNRWFMQMGHWEDITETFNEGPNNLWTNHYDMAVAANMALEGIEELV